CGPCKMLSPIIESIAPEFEGKVIIGKVNVDSCVELAAKYGIISIPTLLFFKDGKVISQHTGLLSANALKEKIKSVFTI
ncbi:MAG: thioredoxin domain-containing protein, partial [Chitinispirillaceae bacterium]|nr:thioredoxin domain-containing protein [Chitinispirillaceae bacterium]